MAQTQISQQVLKDLFANKPETLTAHEYLTDGASFLPLHFKNTEGNKCIHMLQHLHATAKVLGTWIPSANTGGPRLGCIRTRVTEFYSALKL